MGTELIVCPLCAEVVHEHTRDSVVTRVRLPSRSPHAAAALAELQRRAIEEDRQEKRAAEAACIAHYRTHHALRYRLWKRWRWTWLMKWPTRRYKHPLPEQQIFELSFPKRGVT